jgi:hypothetical protein
MVQLSAGGADPLRADYGFYGEYDINPPVACMDHFSVSPQTRAIYVVFAIKPDVRSHRIRPSSRPRLTHFANQVA